MSSSTLLARIKAGTIFPTLLLMVSFAIVNAILFTPALPDVAEYFAISQHTAQQTMLWFLPGYALSQLLYAPLANYFGRKPALYAGIILQIFSSLLCVFSGWVKLFPLFLFARFLLALGSGVGLKMTFTFVNEYYPPQLASSKIAYILLGLTVTPGLAVASGGLLTSYYSWQSCFYACAAYGVMLLVLTQWLPETIQVKNKQSFNLDVLFTAYRHQFRNLKLFAGGLLMGCANAFVYVFATIAPFLAIKLLGMSSAQYGLYNLLPPAGLGVGLVISARMGRFFALKKLILIGILVNFLGVALLFLDLALQLPPFFSLFLPMIVIYFGIGLVLPNASAIGMEHVLDKAYGSAVINFINIGVSACLVLTLSLYSVQKFSLPDIYLAICVGMLLVFRVLIGQLREVSA